MDIVLAKRQNDRMETLLPRVEKSMVERVEPRRNCGPNIDIELPSRQYERIETEEPIEQKSRTESVEPNRTNDRIDKELPRCACSRTDKLNMLAQSHFP